MTLGNHQAVAPHSGPYVLYQHNTNQQLPSQHPHLTWSEAKNLINAIGYAQTFPRLSLFHFTILWKYAKDYPTSTAPGMELEGWSKRYELQKKLFERMTKWIQSQRFGDEFLPRLYVWVREWGPKKKDHTHLLIYLPNPAIAQQLQDFLLRSGGFGEGIKHESPILHTAPKTNLGKHYVRRYLLKMLPPHLMVEGKNVASYFGNSHHLEKNKPAVIYCKRSGCSRTLDRLARQRDGWVERAILADLDGILRSNGSKRH
ncbi:hypothetical protein HB662_22795 [Roseomonas frigidaquae]|uniref:Inovirus Gp2 family protein n=1 Tax=Falsiroseomonas frigidaquae TaxID=487318 RepID=A0ABX1F5L8_9PROT|nr:hypothetical protein [Falsiroseomonas frigidaquae]NKE47625.1 hypothetical protein [Falsiroseomonas frigidaquae]